jgi:Na+-transporting methylmalonyl-CoA/oxaloacetate decarboxylase beta subunit
MSRSILKIICIVSGILFITLTIFTIVSITQAFQAADAASIGIIGGADAPTALFLLQKLTRTPICSTAGMAFLLFIGTGLALIFTKKKNAE